MTDIAQGSDIRLATLLDLRGQVPNDLVLPHHFLLELSHGALEGDFLKSELTALFLKPVDIGVFASKLLNVRLPQGLLHASRLAMLRLAPHIVHVSLRGSVDGGPRLYFVAGE